MIPNKSGSRNSFIWFLARFSTEWNHLETTQAQNPRLNKSAPWKFANYFATCNMFTFGLTGWSIAAFISWWRCWTVAPYSLTLVHPMCCHFYYMAPSRIIVVPSSFIQSPWCLLALHLCSSSAVNLAPHLPTTHHAYVPSRQCLLQQSRGAASSYTATMPNPPIIPAIVHLLPHDSGNFPFWHGHGTASSILSFQHTNGDTVF